MKGLITVVLFLLSNQLLAQQINGVVKDKATNLPLQNVSITSTSYNTYTSTAGRFSLSKTRIGDTIKFSCIGYNTYYLLLNKVITDTVVIYIEQNSILLRAVTINSLKDYRMDSLKKRKEYASFFNYQSPKFKDIFISKVSYANIPSYNTSTNNTTSLISINLLSAIGLIGKSKAPLSKMQKVLLKDEEDSYIDHTFSKRLVTSITALKSDSLLEFMNTYRPSAKELRKMNSYDLILYIKNSYQTFKNEN